MWWTSWIGKVDLVGCLIYHIIWYIIKPYPWILMVIMVNLNQPYDLVGGFNHLEKYELVNGKDDIPYMKWKIKPMFETTNQK